MFSSRVYVAWLALFGLVLRLHDITGEVYGKHGWRQADMAMVARNFHRHGLDIFFPQIDWAGPNPGFIGMEFPLVPYLTALFYRFFGEDIMWGRLLSITFFLVSLGPFFCLVRRYSTDRVARWATFFYVLSPLSIYYSRVLMPESAMVSLSVLSVYFLSQWLETGSRASYFSTALCSCLAVMVKGPAALICFPMACLGMEKDGWKFWSRTGTWVLIFCVLFSGGLWYGHAFAVAEVNPPFEMFGESPWGLTGWYTALLEPHHHRRLFLQSVALIVSPLGFMLAIWGLFKASVSLNSRLFHWWAAGFLFTVLIAYSGNSAHEYYQFPAVPFMAVFAAVGSIALVERWPKSLKFLVVGVVIPSLLLASTRYVGDVSIVLFRAGSAAATVIPRDALVVTWDDGNPLVLYAADRKGWNFPLIVRTQRGQDRRDFQPDQVPLMLEDLRTRGADFLVIPRRRSGEMSSFERFKETIVGPPPAVGFPESSEYERWLKDRYETVLEHPDVIVYSLDE